MWTLEPDRRGEAVTWEVPVEILSRREATRREFTVRFGTLVFPKVCSLVLTITHTLELYLIGRRYNRLTGGRICVQKLLSVDKLRKRALIPASLQDSATMEYWVVAGRPILRQWLGM